MHSVEGGLVGRFALTFTKHRGLSRRPLCYLNPLFMMNSKSNMLLFWLPLMLLPGMSQGQSTGGKAFTLRYEYLNLGLQDKHELVLTVQGSESLSVIRPGESMNKEKQDAQDFSVKADDDIGRQVYKNSKTRETVFRDFYPSGGSLEPCVVRDPASKMSWKFLSEKKQIGPYACKSAQTVFRGRTYHAWYTDQLPIMHGPWKFTGLPGALVEVESADHIILIRLTKVESEAVMSIQKPAQGLELTMQEYVKRKESAVEELLSALKAKLPRGAEVTVNSTGDYNFETDFSDVKK